MGITTSRQDIEQAQVVAFLASPAPHGGSVPRHIETHLSHVFLGPERALKLKKEQAWSVVDYATLERREHFCRREIAVNAPFAPELYLGVRPVVMRREGLALGRDDASNGTVVDWVVEMRRFPDGAQLDAMVDAGTITQAAIDATADAVAAMHARSAPIREPGAAQRVRTLLAQLHDDVTAELADPALRGQVERWATHAGQAARRHRGRLERRGRHGFVRRCHGDLHLSNICMWNGKPVPFDAIEFSDDIATIDVLYDLAFVLVDLEHRGRRDLSIRLLSRYLSTTRDYGALALLGLFKSTRAMVRALVSATKGRDPRAHVHAALACLNAPPQARLVAVGGLSGSGKSTLAARLSSRIDAVVIRSDVARKHLMGVVPEVRLPSCAYDDALEARTYRRVLCDARRALVAGAPAILDATFCDARWRDAAQALARELAVPFCGLWLAAPHEVLTARVAARFGDASDADAAVVAAQLRRDVGEVRWHRIDASGAAAATAAAVEALLEPA